MMYIEFVMAFGTILQITIAIMLVIILLVIGFAVFNLESLKALQDSNKLKRKTEIFRGIKDLRMLPDAGEIYNTQDSNAASYKDLTLAVNQKSGAEFTYNFWLMVKSFASAFTRSDQASVATDQGIDEKDFILLLRGDSHVYEYKNVCGKNKKDIMVKCPLIKLSQGGDVLSVEFNTVATPDPTHEQSRNTCNDLSSEWSYMNNHKVAITDFLQKVSLFENKFFMITVVIQDTNPVDPLPMRNKARCRIFINGVMELDRYVDGKLATNKGNPQVLLQNRGNLYIAPKATWDSKTSIKLSQSSDNQTVYMADLSYYNYSLTPEEIKDLFSNQFSHEVAQSIGQQQSAQNNIWDNVSYTGEKKQLTAF
jgi:uncharacterized protein YhhL (DUF1145 family)